MTLAMFRTGPGQQAAVGSDPVELIGQARAMAVRAGAHGLVVKAAIKKRGEGMAIQPDAIARGILFAIEQPGEVDVGSIVIRPTAQD